MIKERIKEIRQDNNLSQKAFGEMLGVSRDVITNIEYGRVKPKQLLLNHMCEVFNINKEWLIEGTGEMYIVPLNTIKQAKIIAELNTNRQDLHELIEKILLLNDDNQDLIKVIIDTLLSKQKKQKD